MGVADSCLVRRGFRRPFPRRPGADEVVDVEADIEPKRARNDKGQLVGDDPDTPDVNEAWEGGKAPAKKAAKKKTTKKKSTKKSK